MAVDANILICERIREERNAGRSLQRAVSEGYDRALTTIVDANVTSLITAIFLYQFGSGPGARASPITLAIGLVVSMFTAIYVTRTVNDWLMRARPVQRDPHARHGQAAEDLLGRAAPHLRPPLGGRRRVRAPRLRDRGPATRSTTWTSPAASSCRRASQKPTTVDDVKRHARTRRRTEIRIVTEEYDENNELVRTEHTVQAGPYPTAEVVAVGEPGEGVEITIQRGLDQEDVAEQDRLSLEVQSEAFQGYVREGARRRASVRRGWRAVPREYARPRGGATTSSSPWTAAWRSASCSSIRTSVVTAENLRPGARQRHAVLDDGAAASASAGPPSLLNRTVVRAPDARARPAPRSTAATSGCSSPERVLRGRRRARSRAARTTRCRSSSAARASRPR